MVTRGVPGVLRHPGGILGVVTVGCPRTEGFETEVTEPSLTQGLTRGVLDTETTDTTATPRVPWGVLPPLTDLYRPVGVRGVDTGRGAKVLSSV